MTELSRSLLAAAREGLAPDADVAARVRAKVASAVGATAVGATAGSAAAVGATAGSAAGSATAGSAAAGATAGSAAAVGATTGAAAAIPIKAGFSSAALLKLGVALLVVGAVTTAALVSDRDRTPASAPPPPPLAVTSPDTDEVRADIRVVAPNDPLAAPAPQRARAKHSEPSAGHPTHATRAHSTSAHASAPRAGETAPASPAQPGPATAPAPAATPQPATLSREVELIDLAMVSLRRNAPRVALEAIRVFERETLGVGQMAEEAAAIEIEARCKLHEDVTAALARFDREWPNSAQRARIQATCFARK